MKLLLLKIKMRTWKNHAYFIAKGSFSTEVSIINQSVLISFEFVGFM